MITFVHPADIARCQGVAADWIYADSDAALREKIRSTRGGDPALRMGPRRLQEKAAMLRAEYVAWVDRSMESNAPEYWIASSLGRDPEASELFLHLCWLSLLRDSIAGDRRDLIVVSASRGFVRSAMALCREKGASCRVINLFRYRAGDLRALARTAIGSLVRAAQLVFRMLLVRVALGRSYRARLSATEIVVSTYVHESDLSAEGEFRDRYFRRLVDYYEKQNRVVAILPKHANPPNFGSYAFYQRMRTSRSLFLSFEAFLGMDDLIRGLWLCIRMMSSPARIAGRFQGMDVSALAAYDHRRIVMGSHAILVSLFAWRKISRHPIRPRTLVLWYENRPDDKAIVLGLRSSPMADSCHAVAVRQYTSFVNLLGAYATDGEVRAGVSPRENWVCGPGEVQRQSIYDRLGSYRVVPALRYAHLHVSEEISSRGEGEIFLVLLTSLEAESLEIIQFVVSARPLLSARFTRIVIKPHPDLGTPFLAEVVRRWPEAAAFEWRTAPLEQVFPEAQVVMGTRTSATVEAICRGIPVIVPGRKAGLDLNPLEQLDRRLWQVVYEGDDLRRTIEAWTPQHPLSLAERIVLGKEIRDSCFAVPNEETMRSFLPAQEEKAA